MLPAVRNGSTWHPVAGPINRLDTLFERFFGEDPTFASPAWNGMPISVWEDEENVHVEADLPGVAESDLDITLHNGLLSIRGERRPEEGRRYLYNGRSFGRFERVVSLPESVNADGVRAALENGILRLAFPKTPESRPRKIALRSS